MSDVWNGTGTWNGWKLTTDHAASSYGQPVLVSPTGKAYSPGDIEPDKYTQSDLARVLGVTRGAIQDRLKRGTLPAFDGPGYWRYDSIRHLIP